MKFMRLISLTIVALLSLAACGKDDEPTASAQGAGSNTLLSYVPVDTPYVFANLEPVPDDVIDTYLARVQPLLDAVQTQLEVARADLESTESNLSVNPQTRLAHALLLELDGSLSRSGLEEMGFDLQAEKVVYGAGAFPVIRLGLADPAALRTTIERVMNNAGIEAPEQLFQGVPFWRISDGNEPQAPAGIYVSILDNHLAISVFPPLAEAELLPAFLGLEMPAESDAQARLAQLNSAHDYTPYGSGILDLHRLANQFIGPDTVTARALAATGEFDPASFSQECVTEIHEIIDNAPVMTMGVRELSTSAIAFQYRLETPKTLASQLVGLVSKIPAADALSNRMLEFSFGMRFGPVRDFLREKISSIVENPYQCEHLLDLNESASEALAQLDQPMPPFVNNFRGIRVSLTEIMMNRDSIPETARGHLAVHVEKPEMFIGMAQMFLPDLSALAITPGDPPVRLPESLIPVPGIVAYAAMTTDAIGLAVGEGEEESLLPYLKTAAGPEGTFVSIGYDMAAYLDYTDKLRAHYKDEINDEADSIHHQAAWEINQAANKVLRNMSDRSYSTLSFTPQGFVADNRVTFK